MTQIKCPICGWLSCHRIQTVAEGKLSIHISGHDYNEVNKAVDEGEITENYGRTHRYMVVGAEDYAYADIEEYEQIVGRKVNEAFRIGWDMGRTKMKHQKALGANSEDK